ncbi:ribonuclease H-like domain-containing protein [Tanacetum coccineum]
MSQPIALNTSGPVPYISGPIGYYPTQLAQSHLLAQPTYTTQHFQSGSTGFTVSSGQATVMPYAFTMGTFHDPAFGAWNFDTGASSHLNNSVNSLSEIFDTCMYPSVSVGDGHSIPVTNTGHTPSPIPHAFLVSQHTWHQRLGHPGGEVLRRLVSSNFISCNKEKPPVLCHAC